jgi:hypothetical protein
MDIPDGGKGLTIGTKKITLRNQKQMVDTSDHIYMTRKKGWQEFILSHLN